jgi:hypothetical protein
MANPGVVVPMSEQGVILVISFSTPACQSVGPHSSLSLTTLTFQIVAKYFVNNDDSPLYCFSE